MKMSVKRLVFFLLQILFIAVIPLIIVYVGYGGWGEEATTFKWYFGVLILIAIIFLVVKKTLITPWLERQRIKAGNLEADLEKENDVVKIAFIEQALRKARVIEQLCNWLLPLLLLVLAFLAFRAVEKELVTFAGILGFVLLSEALGFVCAILEALCVESKHRKKKE